MPTNAPLTSTIHGRWQHNPLYRWWRLAVVGSVDHARVVARIVEDSGWSLRYGFMTLMSAGIAVLGLLLSSPAVVIGAMLISPLMSPILGLGFSLALFDFAEMRRSLLALIGGSVLAVAFTALIVLASPLQAATAEIIARTRPNLFDLVVALFAAMAGTFAIIRGRGETIVGVAIATALMPPLAVVGFGLATWNMPVLGGALALFGTNFVTIALAATVMARFYGFGHILSSQQSWAQTILLLLVFVTMSIPLGISLRQIASEAVAVTQVRTLLSDRFGNAARVTQLAVDFDAIPVTVRAVVITPRGKMQQTSALQAALEKELGRPLSLQLDQILLEPGAGALDAQREQLRQSSNASAAETQRIAELSRLLSLASGVAPENITTDRDHRRATVAAMPLPGATLATYRALEERLTAQADGWQVTLIPPQAALPVMVFTDVSDQPDAVAQNATLTAGWAAARWNFRTLSVAGLPPVIPDKPNLAQRRAIAIAAILRSEGIGAVPAPAPASGNRITLGALVTP